MFLVYGIQHQYFFCRYSTVQCSAVQCSAVQCSAVQYSTVQYSTVQYSTVQYSTVQSRSIFIKIDNPDIRRIILTLMIFQEKLASAKRLIVVGNGGIATELGMILFFKTYFTF